MALFHIDDILSGARTILSENEEIDTLLSGMDLDTITPENNDILRKMVCKAVDRVHVIAPQAMIKDAAVSYDMRNADNQSDPYCTKVNFLSSRFLRLVYFKAAEWRVPIYTLTDSSSEEYGQARSPFRYVRPSERNPMVAILLDTDGTSVRLEAYPKHIEGADMQYIAKAALNENDEVNISTLCYDAVLYMIASLYYSSVNEKERAAMMEKRCYELLNLQKKDGTNQQV